MRLPLLVAVATLASVTLACAIFNSHASNTNVAIARLPTLTRTPLPTLSPTPLTASQTGAPAQVAVVAVSPPVSDPALTGAAGDDVASNAPAAVEGDVSAPADNVPANQPDAASAPAEAPASEASTLNSTPVAGSTPAPEAATSTATVTLPTPTATPTATLASTPTATPTATATTPPLGWAFASVRANPDQDAGGLLLYGDMINNTGASQELAFVTGTFYDAQGQVIAGEDRTFDYWPVNAVPPGGRVPFELAVEGIQSAANFDLSVNAEPSEETPHQDFEVSDVSQWNEEDAYCLKGTLRNLGGQLQEYLIVIAVLYDSQDSVINFSEYEEYAPEEVLGDQTSTFEICVDPPNQGVARYEVRALGL